MDQQFIRKGHIIRDMKGDIVFTGTYARGGDARPSNNAAKRESRKLQGQNLGSGILRVAA